MTCETVASFLLRAGAMLFAASVAFCGGASFVTLIVSPPGTIPETLAAVVGTLSLFVTATAIAVATLAMGEVR